MPTIAENLALWGRYDWPSEGDEWSRSWGSVERQWLHTVYPRIEHAVPTHTILEIAPGFGRWTAFLLGCCKVLHAVDMVERCVARCRERFRDRPHGAFHLNDGTSLAMIPDDSIDFVFSFDSLVHAEMETIDAYLGELGHKLKIGGAGFIHHSNIGAYVADGKLSIPNPHLRAASMTAPAFAEMCSNSGLRCVAQETVNWGQDSLIDCFSSFVRPREKPGGSEPPMRFRANCDFEKEVENARWMSSLYPVPASSDIGR